MQRRDGYDTVEWLARRPWSTGKVGSFGASFAGFNQYTMAGDLPPHLIAAFPRQAPCSLRREWVYRGGAFEFAFLVLMFGGRQSPEALRNRAAQLDRLSLEDPMAFLTRQRPDEDPLFSHPFQWLHDYAERQDDEQYWSQWDIAPHHCAAASRPAYHMASWYDIFLGGTLRNFIGMRAQAGNEQARRSHRLIIGPWLHGPWTDVTPQGRLAGEMDFGEVALWDLKKEIGRWFAYWLQGCQNGIMDEPSVRYFVMSLNQWRTAEDWPPPGIEYRNFYFSRQPSGAAQSLYDGSLVADPAVSLAAPVAYVHDPEKPVPSLGGNTLFFLTRKSSGQGYSWEDLNAQAGCKDQQPIECFCVTFTSAPLTEDLEVTGPVVARLYLSSSAVDTDLVVRLCDVYPDGRSMLICDGIQRARYRESDFKPSLLEPGAVYPITVDLWATSNLFRAGHRLRVAISSSCFPRFDLNPGTGEPAWKAKQRVRAENRIYVDRDYPSHIVLPVWRLD